MIFQFALVIVFQGKFVLASKMTRIEREKSTVGAMISYYCKKNHGSKNMCSSCSDLFEYAKTRLDKCQFGNEKPVCKECTVHCYSKVQAIKIKEIMSFSGPAMLFRHPILAIYHLLIDSK